MPVYGNVKSLDHPPPTAAPQLYFEPCCLAALLPCYPAALLPCCLTALLPCCLTALLPCCLTALLPCCLTALLPCCLAALSLRAVPMSDHCQDCNTSKCLVSTMLIMSHLHFRSTQHCSLSSASKESVCDSLKNISFNDGMLVSVNKVLKLVENLESEKSAGMDGLIGECMKNADSSFNRFYYFFYFLVCLSIATYHLLC